MREFEFQIYKIIARELSSQEVEEWLYSTEELEKVVSSSDYMELLSLDYNKPCSENNAVKILTKYIDIGKYNEWLLRRILKQIINRPPDVHIYIEQCYHLYGDGYNFLNNIGLGYGLYICVPPNKFYADNWDELSSFEQTTLIDSFYPGIREEIEKVLYWLDLDKIILTGYDELSQQTIQYQDSRTLEEKKPTAYIKAGS